MAFGQHVSGFSHDNKLFALINEQGILRIWDTETNELKQEYTPNLHLAGPCTSLQWIVTSNPKQSKKKEKNLITEQQSETLYIALGASTGSVSLYLYASGQIEFTFKGECHSGKITCMAYDNQDILFTSGEDCKIILWSLSQGKRIASWSVGPEKPYSITYISKSKNIVVGGRQIKVYSIETQELLQTFIGHNSEIILLTSLEDESSEYVLSASKMERILCLWTIGKTDKKQNTSCTFLMEDIANLVTCQINKGILKVASVTRSGVIHIYKALLESIGNNKVIKPELTIEVASNSSTVVEPISVVAASLHLSKKRILIGYGDKQFIMFEKIAPNYAEKLQVLARTDPKQILTSSAKKQRLQNISKTISPIVNENEVEYKSATVLPKSESKLVGLTMETRLENLHLNIGETPQPESQTQLLIQALHSKNSQLLRTVFSTSNPNVIKITLEKLPVTYIDGLIDELTLLMTQKRLNVEVASAWLKILLETHSSQLMALGTDVLLTKFSRCVSIIEHRINCLKELSKLNGRLELVLTLIAKNITDDVLNSQNVVTYEDSDSTNSELDEEKSLSDDDWEQEDSDIDQEM